jgi:hypothetical protein
MISLLTAVVGGSATAFLAHLLHAPLSVADAVGGGTACLSAALAIRWQRQMHFQADKHSDALYPTSTPTAGPRAAAEDRNRRADQGHADHAVWTAVDAAGIAGCVRNRSRSGDDKP